MPFDSKTSHGIAVRVTFYKSEDQIQDLVCARRVPYHLSTPLVQEQFLNDKKLLILHLVLKTSVCQFPLLKKTPIYLCMHFSF